MTPTKLPAPRTPAFFLHGFKQQTHRCQATPGRALIHCPSSCIWCDLARRGYIQQQTCAQLGAMCSTGAVGCRRRCPLKDGASVGQQQVHVG